MSELKISPDLFIGVAELKRLVKFLKVDGFNKLVNSGIKHYGIAKLASDVNFEALKIVAGSTASKITIKSGALITPSLNIINVPENILDVITLATDNVWRWVKISYQGSSQEEGTVAIDAAGNLTGTSTKFLEVLRGATNYPSIIKFPNSATNTQEYEVLSIASNTSAVLNSAVAFTPESGQKYVVVGTFTAGKNPQAGDKDIFVYDSYSVVVENDDVLDAEQFLLAKVRTNGTTLEIQDIRSDIFSYEDISSPIDSNNPVFGVEWQKFDVPDSDQSANLVRIGWGFRSASFVINQTNRTITLNSGSGGTFKTNTDFTAGDFDDWYVYLENGYKIKVLSSTISGGLITLNVDALDSTKVVTTGTLTVVPDVDTVEILANHIGVDENMMDNWNFPASTAFAYVRIKRGMHDSEVELSYRHIKNNIPTTWRLCNDGQYFTPECFDEAGNQSSFTLDGTIDGGDGVMPLQPSPTNLPARLAAKASLGSANVFTSVQIENINTTDILSGDATENIVGFPSGGVNDINANSWHLNNALSSIVKAIGRIGIGAVIRIRCLTETTFVASTPLIIAGRASGFSMVVPANRYVILEQTGETTYGAGNTAVGIWRIVNTGEFIENIQRFAQGVQSSNVTYAAVNEFPLKYNTVSYGSGWLNGVNGKFTPAKVGFYRINAMAILSTTGDHDTYGVNIHVKKNGVKVLEMDNLPSYGGMATGVDNVGVFTLRGSLVVESTSEVDYFEVCIYSAAGTLSWTVHQAVVQFENVGQ